MPGVASLQSLELRILFDAGVVDITSVSTAAGTELRIAGTDSDDLITLSRKGRAVLIGTRDGSTLFSRGVSTIRIDGGAGNDHIIVGPNIWTSVAIYGGDGDDTLVGGTGNDRLYGQAGADVVNGAGGDDTIVTLGDDASDRAIGGAGVDSFWVGDSATETIDDVSDDELAAGAIHRITSFVNDAGTQPELTAVATGYSDFIASPLFSRFGPQVEDITQGQLGDCFLLAALASIAKANPQVIQQSMADLGDGTYAVRFVRDSQEVYVHVDGNLPVDVTGNLIYAKKGIRDSIWAPIFEKAYAIQRLGSNSYQALEGGFPGEIYEDLGLPTLSVFSVDNADELLKMLGDAVDTGQAVTIGVNSAVDDPQLISGHAYMVDAVQTSDSGDPMLLLRNTWPSDDASSYYISLGAEDALGVFWFASMADVHA